MTIYNFENIYAQMYLIIFIDSLFLLRSLKEINNPGGDVLEEFEKDTIDYVHLTLT